MKIICLTMKQNSIVLSKKDLFWTDVICGENIEKKLRLAFVNCEDRILSFGC
jgi:hypothetical protein